MEKVATLKTKYSFELEIFIIYTGKLIIIKHQNMSVKFKQKRYQTSLDRSL